LTGFTTEDARPPLPVPDPVVDTRSLEGDRIRLLLVEADQAAARALQHELREDDPAFEVATVDRLDAALDHLGAAATDAVVVDLSLPDSRGLETLSALRAGALALPIVVLAGGDDEELALRALGVGASDHLVKGRVTGDLVARAVR
jgi:DNA-binding response OmpR family regulator